jgi:hypothetical protein
VFFVRWTDRYDKVHLIIFQKIRAQLCKVSGRPYFGFAATARVKSNDKRFPIDPPLFKERGNAFTIVFGWK